MSLTSYRAAPPRGVACCGFRLELTRDLIRGRGLVRPAALPGWPGLSARLASPVATAEPGLRRVSGGFGRPGGDLLFRALRRSTIGAEGFHGRVRDGIGC